MVGESDVEFKVSRMGGDGSASRAARIRPGNGFQIAATAAGTVTVWRQYASPVYSWWDITGAANEQFYLPDFSVVNIRFLPMYVKWIFGTEAAPAAGCPPAYGGMDYMPIFTTGAQFGYVETVGEYDAGRGLHRLAPQRDVLRPQRVHGWGWGTHRHRRAQPDVRIRDSPGLAQRLS